MIPLQYYDKDPNTDGAGNPSGVWDISTANCCGCPNPPLSIGFSSRTRVGTDPFGDWTDYDFGAGEYVSGLYPESNTDPSNGGAETQTRARFIVNGNGVAGVVRFRQLFSEDVGSPTPQTIITPGETQVINVPADNSTITTDFAYVPCSIGQTSVLVGGPGGGVGGSFSAIRQTASLTKKGFRQYVSDSPAIKIYRQEVATGSDPGCPLNLPVARAPKSYSGSQIFDAVAATPANNYLADPAGSYVNSLSSDLLAAHYATVPYLQSGESVEFGVISNPDNVTRKMQEIYQCRGPVAKILQLALVNEYPTAAMVTAVNDALASQISNNAPLAPVDIRIVHRQWLSPMEVHYDRVQTSEIVAAPGPFNQVLGGPGQIVILNAVAHLAIRPLDPGSPVAETTKAFAVKIQASDDNLVATAGRPAVDPTDPITPTPFPWEAEEFNNTEVLITKVTVKPNSMLSVFQPVIEDPSVIDIGVD